MFFPEPDVIQTYWRLKDGTCVCSKLVLLVIKILSNFKPRLNNDFIILCRLCFLRTFPCIRLIYLLHLVLSVWVAAVKCRPVLHHNSVVIFFWSGIMDCMLFTFQNRVPLMLYELSVVWQLSLPMMNNFNKTEAAIFPCRLCFQRASPFIS